MAPADACVHVFDAQIFTDYNIINPDDHAFLSLPMSFFNVFASSSQPNAVSCALRSWCAVAYRHLFPDPGPPSV